MKNNPTLPSVLPEPNEADIRDYAFHLYVQNRCTPGHDLDDWLEAAACLKANIPPHQAASRLHRHVNGPARGETPVASVEASSFRT